MISIGTGEDFYEMGRKFFFEQKDYPRAAQAFEVAVLLCPYESNGHFLLGASLVESGEIGGAILPLARCVYIDPEHRDGRNALGMVLRWLGWGEDGLIQLARAAYLGHLQAPDTLAEAGVDFCRKCARHVGHSFAGCPRCAGKARARTSPRLRAWPFAHLPEDDWRSRLSLPGGELSDLGLQYLRRHQNGEEEDALELAITYFELAAAATNSTAISTKYPKRLSDLGLVYRERFAYHGLSEDLEYAVDCGEQAHATALPEISEWATICSNLGLAYLQRHEYSGSASDLDRAIMLLEKALSDTNGPPGDRPAVLANAGRIYQRRFQRYKSKSDLDRSIGLLKQAVAATPADHWRLAVRLNNLGAALQERFELTAAPGDLDQAVLFLQRAVETTPEGHRGRPLRLANLGVALMDRFAQHHRHTDLKQGISYIGQAAAATLDGRPELSLLLSHLGKAYRLWWEAGGLGVDQQTLHTLARRLAAATAASPQARARAGLEVGMLAQAMGEHATAVTVLDPAVRLLPIVPVKDADWGDRESRLGNHLGLAVEAIAAHCGTGDVVGAVEISELGRGILLAAQLESRTDLSDLDEQLPELAGPIRQLRELLNSPSGAGDRTSLWTRHDQLVSQIRTHPRFDRFLLPPRLADLQPAAVGGTVVLVNAASQRSDAILISADRDPVHVELDDLAISEVKGYAQALLRAIRSTGKQEHIPLQAILGWLWDTIVSRVIKALPASQGHPRRVWWLPIGLLGLFPLHAAGRPGQPDALDAIVSSYTPTLRVLAHTRAQPPTTIRRQLTVALARTPGLPDLLGTICEAHELHRKHPSGTWLVNREATTAEVLAALPEATWTHFACHARADHSAPSTGGLRLHDGTLTIPEIVRLDLAHAELAYLSACSTADRSPDHIEESINLASAFHLAGFRHVIASLWPLADGIAVEAARAFYQALPSNPTASNAALALNQATRELRANYHDRPELWAPLIHSGP
ncbi:CHAT domain-containing protein [Actinomadura sp. GC306]|uniref:CHAT domain-containing protein n=1 Tax=Actinomadura sp. GC306 TaxID=2530367 RepID=UPI0010511160|nr:CHAT domain-containing protein [Actinomadura sp. GC306]TDC63559.1 CHAT domain-containing protein [Actinomadura sp. GC306]